MAGRLKFAPVRGCVYLDMRKSRVALAVGASAGSSKLAELRDMRG